MTQNNEMIVGLSVETLLLIRNKLDNLGLDLEDILSFLDRNTIQLFAELRSENKSLKRIIDDVNIQTSRVRD